MRAIFNITSGSSGPPVAPDRVVTRPPIAPVRRKLPPPPPRARQAVSAAAFPPAQILMLSGPGAEDIVADTEARLICGLGDGRIVRLRPDTGAEETICETHGRPLGLELLTDGRVLIYDARRGLLRLDPTTGTIETLVADIDGVPLRFCSNVVAGADGSYWFTESTDRFNFANYLGTMLEHRPSAPLFRRTPHGKVDIIIDRLHFPNGLTLVENGTALVFAETDGYRLTKLDLTGKSTGRTTVLVDNLPDFPDNLSRFCNGRFWVAMVSPRNAALDRAGTPPPMLRRLAQSRMHRTTPTHGTTWARAIDATGKVVADYQTIRPDFLGATGVAQIGDRLYLASVDGASLLEVELP